MMHNTYWNIGATDSIKGLDVLGVRASDQAIEGRWVHGVTTVSQRARYFSILPWFAKEFYARMQKDTRGDLTASLAGFLLCCERLELVTALAALEAELRDAMPAGVGVIGADKYEAQIKEFRETGQCSADNPSARPVGSDRNSLLWATYFNPITRFGLLGHAWDSDPEPFKLTERGERMHEIRAKLVRENPLIDIIFRGGIISTAALQAGYRPFAIQMLDAEDDERSALVEALTRPATDASREIDEYEHFIDTLKWVYHNLGEGKIHEAVIHQNFQTVTDKGRTDVSPVEYDWFLYDLKRRVHYGLELMLESVTLSVTELGSATVEQIVKHWNEEWDELKVSSFFPSLPNDVFTSRLSHLLREQVLGEIKTYPYPDRSMNAGPDSRRGMYGMLMILHAYARWVKFTQNSTGLDNDQDRSRIDYQRKAFQIIEAMLESTVGETLQMLLSDAVVESHMRTTLRKMAQGQHCSLRFFLDGARLYPMGPTSHAGRSGSRLVNVLQISYDLGLIARKDDGSYVANDRTGEFLQQVRRTYA